MDCKDFQVYGSAYIDNMLSKEEELDFKNHIKKCTDCNIAFENMKTVVESVNMLEEVELPTNFSNELHDKLQSTKNYKSKPTLSNKSKILSNVAITLLILVLSLTLVNNFLNYKKGVGFYGKIDNITKEEENIDINVAPDETKEKTLDKIDDEEPIMSLRMAPSHKNEMCRDTSKEVQGNAKENGDEGNKSIERSDDSEKSAADESVQNPLNNKNLNKIFNSIAVLILIICAVILIYKVPKR